MSQVTFGQEAFFWLIVIVILSFGDDDDNDGDGLGVKELKPQLKGNT